MKTTGRYVSAAYGLDGKLNITLQIDDSDAVEALNGLQDGLLSIEVKKYRRNRSKDANALLWACVGEIASAIGADKWDVYLQLLKRYGKFTYIAVSKHAADEVKKVWRETEVVGEVQINGVKRVNMLCYFGSSTYNTKEFSVLLDGVISEMRDIGLRPPASDEMKRSLEEWERLHSVNE